MNDHPSAILRQLKAQYADSMTAFFNSVQGSVEEYKTREIWQDNAHSLALKMFRHLGSVKTLCETYADIPPSGFPSYYIDFSSAQITTRAAIETFLIFAHIFGQSDLTLAKFRCEIWRLSGLADRQKMNPMTSANQRQLHAEKEDMEELRVSISNSPYLESLFTPGQAKQVLCGNWSKLRDWKSLAEEAGIHPRQFDLTYRHLSGFSHSSYISALQISQARSLPVQEDMACFCLQTCLFYTAHFLVQFAKNSPSASHYLANDPGAKNLIDTWHITADNWDKLYSRIDAENYESTGL